MRPRTFILAGIHLLILASGILAFSKDGESRWLLQARDFYQLFTGAGGSWGFFSPDIGNQVLVEFQTDRGQRILLHRLVSPEVALRIGNMYRFFVQSYGNEKLKRSIAASLTAQIFNRFPDVHEATFFVMAYRFPSLVESERGERPETKELYHITFKLGENDAASHR